MQVCISIQLFFLNIMIFACCGAILHLPLLALDWNLAFFQESNRDMEENNFKRRLQLPIKKYALRFLSYSKSADCSVQAEAPMTPDRISDARILQLSCEDRYSEVWARSFST